MREISSPTHGPPEEGGCRDLGRIGQDRGLSRDMITRLKYRNLLKVCLSRRKEDMTREQIERLANAANNPSERRELRMILHTEPA